MKRFVPAVTAVDAPFWSSGSTGHLVVQRCTNCGTWSHPPAELCSSCHAESLTFTPVSGFGTVYAYTINHHPWIADWSEPYILIVVRLEESDRLQFITNLVGVDPHEVRMGMPVRVTFEQASEDVWIPIFEAANE